MIYNGTKKWNNDKPKSIEEENVKIYLEDMQKKDPRDMKSKIASDAVNEYKALILWTRQENGLKRHIKTN